MATRTVAQKLQIRAGHRVAAINAPSDYRTLVGDLPEGATVGPFSPSIDVVHLFVRDRAELADQAPRVLADVGSDTVLWISYPKRSGGTPTYISRDVGWEILRGAGFDPVSQVAIDDTWSALRFRRDPALRAARAERGAKGY